MKDYEQILNKIQKQANLLAEASKELANTAEAFARFVNLLVSPKELTNPEDPDPLLPIPDPDNAVKRDPGNIIKRNEPEQDPYLEGLLERQKRRNPFLTTQPLDPFRNYIHPPDPNLFKDKSYLEYIEKNLKHLNPNQVTPINIEKHLPDGLTIVLDGMEYSEKNMQEHGGPIPHILSGAMNPLVVTPLSGAMAEFKPNNLTDILIANKDMLDPKGQPKPSEGVILPTDDDQIPDEQNPTLYGDAKP